MRTALGRFAAAVRDRDRSAYAKVLDPAPAATAFRTRQLDQFAALAHVPIGVWRYQLLGLVADATARTAAQRSLAAPAAIAHVRLLYTLRGIDTVPDRHDQYLTFVRRDGATYLSGDQPLAGQSLVSWQGPWAYGPLDAARGTHSLVLAAPGTATAPLAAAVDAAVAAVDRVWGSAWPQRVAVIVPGTAAGFAALSGTDPGVADVSATAVTGGVDPVTNRPYGQRLLLDPAQLDRLTALGRRIVVTHEVTHLATATATADITPRWLVEGFAEYVANLGTGQPVRAAASELAAQLRTGRAPTALPTGSAFAATGAGLAAAYEQAWLACRLIARQAGQAGLVRFYRQIGSALEPQAQAVAAAFRSVLHETQSAFTVAWRTYLRTELR